MVPKRARSSCSTRARHNCVERAAIASGHHGASMQVMPMVGVGPKPTSGLDVDLNRVRDERNGCAAAPLHRIF